MTHPPDNRAPHNPARPGADPPSCAAPSCAAMEPLWDRARDGELAEQDQRRFDEHMDRCDRCDRLWTSETRWLAQAAAPHDDLAATGAGDAFTERVLAAWAQPAASPGPFSIVAWRRWALPGAIAAAAGLALAASAWIVNYQPPARQGTGPVAAAPSPSPSHPAAGPLEGAPPADPISLLVCDASDQLAASPQLVQASLRRTSRLLSWDTLSSVFDNPVAVPDPREYVTP